MTPAEVWCDQCTEPATEVIRLTDGSLVHRCSTHAWLLRAPKGTHR